MSLLHILVGLGLLTLGRKLFWLFVGCVGFIAGFTYVHHVWGAPSDLVILLIALVIGVIGALLALFLQGVAIGLAGFIAGGYSALTVMDLFGLGGGQLSWLLYVIAGIIGVILVFMIFDWALIVLSSLTGAALIVQVAEFSSRVELVIFFVLMILGVLFQARIRRRKPPR